VSVYQYAPGHNNAEGLVALDPQPMSPGLLYPLRIYAASGEVYDHGSAYTIWRYNFLTPAQYAALLSALGLASAVTAPITATTITDAARTTWANYNARIVRPAHGTQAQFRRGFWRDVEFVLRELEALT